MGDYVRVATFDGDEASLEAMLNEINSTEGSPPGIPAKSIMVLADRAAGKIRVVVRFGSEEDLRTGSATLDGMSPPKTAAPIRRTSVETFEVVLERQAP